MIIAVIAAPTNVVQSSRLNVDSRTIKFEFLGPVRRANLSNISPHGRTSRCYQIAQVRPLYAAIPRQ